MKQDLRWVTFKIENKKEIVPEEIQEDKAKTWEDFSEMIQALTEPRFALMDIDFMSEDKRPQSKLAFVMWSPDTGNVKDKMLYASSKDAIKKKFPNVKDIQANDKTDLDWEKTVLPALRK